MMANKKNQRKARGERARASWRWRVNTRIKVNRNPVHREMKTARVGGTRWRPSRARAALEPKPMAARNPKRMARVIFSSAARGSFGFQRFGDGGAWLLLQCQAFDDGVEDG